MTKNNKDFFWRKPESNQESYYIREDATYEYWRSQAEFTSADEDTVKADYNDRLKDV